MLNLRGFGETFHRFIPKQTELEKLQKTVEAEIKKITVAIPGIPEIEKTAKLKSFSLAFEDVPYIHPEIKGMGTPDEHLANLKTSLLDLRQTLEKYTSGSNQNQSERVLEAYQKFLSSYNNETVADLPKILTELRSDLEKINTFKLTPERDYGIN